MFPNCKWSAARRAYASVAISAVCLTTLASPGAAQSLTNASFESPAVTADTDALRPATATWTFAGQAGIRNNSAPNGSDSKQAAFLSAAPVSGNNNFGSVRQTVTLKVGTYYVRYLGAVKTPTGRPQPLQFYVNSVAQGGVLNPRYLTDPTTGGFEAGWTQPFVVTSAGSYELRFDATNATNYGTVAVPLYAVAYLDAVTLVSVPGAFANAGFESAGTWTLSSGATLAAATDAPEGTKVLSLAAAATASQTLTLPAGQYSVSLKLGKASVATGTVNLEIASNGAAAGTVATIAATTAAEYRTYTTPAFTLPGGSHVVTLRGSGSSFSVDAIALNDAAPDALNSGFETPVLAAPSSATAAGPTTANPTNASWTFTGTGGLIQANAGTSNTSAPRTIAGKQYLALSGTGAVSQSLALAGGTYVAVGQVAQGGFNVLIDGTTVGKLAASTLDFREVTSAPFVVTAGTHSLGLTVDSTYTPNTPKLDEIRLLRVDVPPAVSITAPANGAVFQTGATVNITATASDPDGISALTISRTPTGGAATQLATSASSPLSTSWSNSSANGYTITASAADSTGATSATAISIRVNANPSAVVSVSPTGPVVTSATAVTATVTVSSATDSDGTVTKIEFLQDAVVATTCTKTIPPAVAPFTCALSLPPRPAAYALTVRVTDNDGGVTTTSTITLRINTAPTVTLAATCVAPCTAPGTINLTATPSDTDGTIAKVEFYDGATLLTTKTTAPWTFSHTTATAGSHSYTAKAFDNDNASISSAAQAITVTAPPPSVSLTAACTSPCNAPAAVTLTAVPTNIVGTISKVEFYDGATLLNTDTTSPYSFAAASVAAATRSYTAKVYVTGTTAAVATSTAQAVRVNALPTVTLTAACVAPCSAPGTVNLAATPADADGTITKVEFYDGASLLATRTAAPWTFSPTTATAGSHSYTAKAFDNDNASITSTAQAITVTAPPPSVALTAACTAPCNAPAAVILTAVPTNIVGTVSKVEFYDGTTLLNTDTTNPYSFAAAAVTAATHSYTAKVYVTGTTTAVATSTAQAVRVNALPTVTLTAACVAPCAVSATVNLTASAADSDGTISRVEFYDGSSLRGTVTVAPWSFTDTSAGAGTHNYTAKAFDNDLASKTSSVATITVTATPPPSVLLTATCDAPCEAPASFTLKATPTNIPGGSSYVDFYDGTTYLWPTVPAGDGSYSYRWTSAGAGSHTVKVVVGSQTGAAETISTVNVNVATPANWPPVVNWVWPFDGAVINPFGRFTLKANATDQDGSIANVKFYADGNLLGEGALLDSAYVLDWMPGTALQSYGLTAVATDNLGKTGTTSVTTVSVSNTVNFTVPTETGFYTDPVTNLATVSFPTTISPTPADWQGGYWTWNVNTSFVLWSVELLQDGVVVDTRKYGYEMVPYSWDCSYTFSGVLDRCLKVWSAPTMQAIGAPVGSRSYMLRVSPGYGRIWQTAPVTMSVADAHPVVTVSGYAGSPQIYQGAVYVRVSAPAFVDNSYATFYENDTQIGSCRIVAKTCTYLWLTATVGAHTISASAISEVAAALGGTPLKSAPYSFNVLANQRPSVAFVAPLSGADLRGPATVTLKATATDADGGIMKVEFLDSTQALLGAGTPNAGNYEFTMPSSNPPEINERVQVYARAFDNGGAQSDLAFLSYTVHAPATAEFVAPCASGVCYAGAVWVSYRTNQAGYAYRVRYLRNGVEFTPTAGYAYRLYDTDTPAGTYEYRVELTTTYGETVLSPPVVVTVSPNNKPTVTITDPTDNAEFYNTLSLTLKATAADSDGAVQSVQFFANDVETYSTSFANGSYTSVATTNSDGVYTISARATDDRGSVGISTSVKVRVFNGPRPVSISVADGARFQPGQTISIVVGGAGSDPAVTRVQLWRAGINGAPDVMLASSNSNGLTYLLTLPTTNQYIDLYTVASNASNQSRSTAVRLFVVTPDIDATSYGVWIRFNEALNKRDKALALSFLTPAAQAIYAPVFDVVNAPGQTFASGFLPGVAVASQSSREVEYFVARIDNGVRLIVSVRLLKMDDGTWQIESM